MDVDMELRIFDDGWQPMELKYRPHLLQSRRNVINTSYLFYIIKIKLSIT